LPLPVQGMFLNYIRFFKMLYKEIFKVLSFFLYTLAAILCIPCVLAMYYAYLVPAAEHPQKHSVNAFFLTILCTLIAAAICHFLGRYSLGKLYSREKIATTVLLCMIVPALSALPFIFSGTLTNFFQAYFEVVSGYTTTGSTVLKAKNYDANGSEIPYQITIAGVIPTTYTFYGTVEPVVEPSTGKVLYSGINAVGKSLLFWRSMTQWLGGIGIIVLFLLVFPHLGIGGKMFYQVEAPGYLKKIAFALFKIYLFLTAMEVILLMLTNHSLPFFDALTISFSNLATGAFSIKNHNIASYNNAYTEAVVMLFMVIGSINFALYYFVSRGKIFRLFNRELFIYLVILLLGSCFVSWAIHGTSNYTWFEAIRYGSFQAVSANSTTGFFSADYDSWPYEAQTMMLILMYVGGMAGSTCGGIKIIRHYMLFKIVQYKTESIIRPEAVKVFRIGNREVDYQTQGSVLCFCVIIVSLSVIFTFLHILDGIDPETAIGMVAANINNAGLAFRMAGPTESYAFLSNYSLVLAALQMIFGRLEFYAVLAVLVPAFWNQNG